MLYIFLSSNMDNGLKYFELAGHQIFVDSNEIGRNGVTEKLTPKEMEVLLLLYKNKGETVSRVSLLESIWGADYANDLGLTQSISKLRRILKDNPKNPRFIKTIPKKGYQLINDPAIGNVGQGAARFPRFFKARNIRILVLLLLLVGIALFFVSIRIRVQPN
ncbi:MAG: winged helix-turn-helix domain-containing protein [Bacteroidota bacterium]